MKAPSIASWDRSMMVLAVGMAVLTAVTAVGILVDDRVLTGAPIWLKPFKFSVSILLYSLALAWMLSLLPRRSPVAERSAFVIVLALFVEMAIVVVQVIRGTTSHFNMSTPFDTALWNTMFAAIIALFFAHVLIAVAVLRARIRDRVVKTGIGLGLGVSWLGLVVAAPMQSAHTVGVPDGGPGLPVTGWSTAGGDLRIGHFIGLHALQVLPLLAWALNRYATRLPETARVRLLLVAGAGYAGLTVLTTWQALRGQPLFEPDGLTLGVLAGLILAVLAGAALSVTRTGEGSPSVSGVSIG
ncbi:hypothetical protein [Actinoplanes couchii]|uniref:Uncharacterized protein n=1 Tax=Actinoplanes couchii TaxID=403638 RepID=A0ABQ3X7W6_9ACTN|nr:hypothetical protein [Actinoplanes couchii]MDR6320380.1 putative membrane protein [Actinoplanes couchii]GID54608.1 hypothetical protein Aco03nite_030120 [Actinoplanes couchii]